MDRVPEIVFLGISRIRISQKIGLRQIEPIFPRRQFQKPETQVSGKVPDPSLTTYCDLMQYNLQLFHNVKLAQKSNSLHDFHGRFHFYLD